MKNTWKAMLRPLLVMGVLAAPAWLGGCGGSGHDNNAAMSNGPLKAGSIVSEKGTVEAVPNPIIGSGPNGQPVYEYVLKGDSSRVYEVFGDGVPSSFRQDGLCVSFTVTVVAPAGTPGGVLFGIPVQVTQISKL